MKINLQHLSNYYIASASLTVPPDTDIADILQVLHASALAKWQSTYADFPYGEVIGSWMENGRLQEGLTYTICSKNIPKTEEVLHILNTGVSRLKREGLSRRMTLESVLRE